MANAVRVLPPTATCEAVRAWPRSSLPAFGTSSENFPSSCAHGALSPSLVSGDLGEGLHGLTLDGMLPGSHDRGL